MNTNIRTQDKRIKHTTFTDLVNANAIRRVEVHNDGKWWVLIRVGNVERILSVKRGHTRRFSSLDSVVKYLQSVGVQRFNVELV